MEPITFTPLYMERVWGGRGLSELYGRELPDQHTPIGESWELVDREEAQSMVDHGTWQGFSLNDLWSQHRLEVFGDYPHTGRFPILLKLLDARSDLSIQVHPPAAIASDLGGEPKTEMWFVAAADPGATLHVGLRKGVSRQDFEQAIVSGSVADCVHAIQPRAGDSIFIPSGRLHAIGGGLLIHEIQQNSDTTYRVFDWNRVGLDGKPRQLHLEASLASIDFADIEPAMSPAGQGVLADCEHFRTDHLALATSRMLGNPDPQRFSVVSIVSGELHSQAGRVFSKGQSLLLPKDAAPLLASRDSRVLQVTLP